VKVLTLDQGCGPFNTKDSGDFLWNAWKKCLRSRGPQGWLMAWPGKLALRDVHGACKLAAESRQQRWCVLFANRWPCPRKIRRRLCA